MRKFWLKFWKIETYAKQNVSASSHKGEIHFTLSRFLKFITEQQVLVPRLFRVLSEDQFRSFLMQLIPSGSFSLWENGQMVNIRVVATTPRKDPQPNISDLRDHSQSIFRPILTRIQKKKKKKLPPLYIDQLKCGIRPPPPPTPPPDPPDAFWGTTL